MPTPLPRKPLTASERRAGILLLLLALLPVVAIFVATDMVSEIALQRFMAAMAAIGFLVIAFFGLRSGVIDGQGETLGARVALLLPGVASLIVSMLLAARFIWLTIER